MNKNERKAYGFLQKKNNEIVKALFLIYLLTSGFGDILNNDPLYLSNLIYGIF